MFKPLDEIAEARQAGSAACKQVHMDNGHSLSTAVMRGIDLDSMRVKFSGGNPSQHKSLASQHLLSLC